MYTFELTKYILVAYLFFLHGTLAEWSERREEVVHPNGKYIVGWKVDFNSSIILFDVLAETTGYVGFGLNSQGGMTGADIIMGGLHANGTVYFSDRHGVGSTFPVLDEQQDWRFKMGYENATHTYLQFSRFLDTCDTQDWAITNGSLHLIWSMGDTDELSYHGATNRGAYAINLLDPAFPDIDLSTLSTWNMTVNMEMPSDHTSYWCTIHRGPRITQKHHIVGFEAKLENELALRHTHHFNIYKCVAPEGVNPEEFFEPYVGQPGGECYAKPDELVVPTRYCQSFLYVWARGGRRFLLPEHVGYPIGESAGNEYYMFEVHYDNPTQESGRQFETGAIVYYTDTPRRYDAGIFLASHTANIALTVPPETSNFTIVGHCDSRCTQSNLPGEGVNMFNVLLHSHLAGRKAKLRHFRGDKELPWISNDENYNFDYQQNRPLIEEVKLLPGDHLSYECNYDTNWKATPEVTIGGLSTREEMCEAFIWYYPRSTLEVCISEYPIDNLFEKFGILEVDWDTSLGGEPIILSPPEMAGLTYSEALNTKFQWSEEIKEELQREHRYSIHQGYCYGGETNTYPTTYPNALEYRPIEKCQ